MTKATGNWREASFRHSDGTYVNFWEQDAILLAADLDAMSKAKVEVIDSSLLKATPEQAKSYIYELLPILYSNN